MKNIKNFNTFITEELNILKGPSDEETEEAIKDMSAVKLFDKCCDMKLGEYYFQKAVEKGLFKNIRKNKQLLMAAAAGSINYIKLALEKGANINYRDVYYYFNTPLFYASENNFSTAVKYLVEHGADVNLGDDTDFTAIMFFCARNNLEMVKYLYEHGADLNIPTNKGQTPIYFAASRNNFEVFKFLYENGAVLSVDIYGKTIMDISIKAKANEIIDYLSDKLDPDVDS
jgi:ankyrin repeat protein